MAAAPLYPCVCPGHSKAVVEISYSRPTSEGVFFISACLDKLPMLRDAATGDWVGTFQGHKGAVWSAKVNSDASLAATGSADFSVKLWDAVDGSEKAHIDHPHIVKSVDFSHDDARLATGGQDKKVRIYDVSRVSAGATAEFVHPKGVRKVVWSPDGRSIYSGSEDGVVRQWDVASGSVVRECATSATGAAVMDLELSADRGLLTVASGQSVTLIDAASMTARHSFGYRYLVESASLLPGAGTHFVAGGTDVHVHVCNAETGEEVWTDRGHHGTVHCVRFHPDGSTYSSGADDATVRLWKFDAERRKGGPASAAAAGTAAAPARAGAGVDAAADATGLASSVAAVAVSS